MLRPAIIEPFSTRTTALGRLLEHLGNYYFNNSRRNHHGGGAAGMSKDYGNSALPYQDALKELVQSTRRVPKPHAHEIQP